MSKKLVMISNTSDVFSDKNCLKQILLEAMTGEEVYLVISSSLDKWTLSFIYNCALETAKENAIKNGNEWCENHLATVKNILGEKLKKCFRWENWLENGDLKFKEEIENFKKICSKESVTKIIVNTFEKSKIDSLETFAQNKKQLAIERAKLIPVKTTENDEDGKWKETSWDNAMAASILEFVIRSLNRTSEKNSMEIVLNNKNKKFPLSFSIFLNSIVDNSFEHLAEETTMLYFCLPHIKEYDFSDLIYPNKEAPIFKKAYIEQTKCKKIFQWKEVKLNSKKQLELWKNVNSIFNNYIDKENSDTLTNLLLPILLYTQQVKNKEMQQNIYGALCVIASVSQMKKKTSRKHKHNNGEINIEKHNLKLK